MKKILFTVLSLVLTLTACQVVETDMIDTTERKSVYKNELIFSASDFKSDETLDTRTDIAPGGGFLWSANDTVGIFPNSGSQVYFAMTSGAGASSATFDGGGWDFKPSAVYRSYYPLIGEFYLDPTKIPVCYLGQKQVGNNNSSRIGPYDFMFTPATSASDGNLHFSYAHLGTIIQPKITLPAGRYVTMTLIAPDPVFVETGHFDLTSSSPAIVGDSYSRTLSINLDVTLSSESQLITYILSAPLDLSGKTLTVIVQDDEGNSYTGLKPIPNNKPFVAEMKYGLNIASTTLGPAPNEIWYRTMSAGSTSSVVPFTPSEYKISAGTGNRLDLANCVVPGADNGYRGILRFKGPITEIDQYAFSNTDVWKVTLPDCVQTIHRGAFQQCAMLSVANLGTGIKSIGEYAFSGTDLSSINLPEGLERIGAFAFEGNHLVTRVTIPESVTHLGFREDAPFSLAPLGNPFFDCSYLRRFEGKFATQDGRALIEDSGINKYFVSFATNGMDGQAYHVPEVYGVSPYAFGNSTIGSVTFSDNIKTIYAAAFWNCEQLKSVEIPSSLERMGGYAFNGCSALEFIEINSPQLLIAYDNQGHMFDGSNCPIYVVSDLIPSYKTAQYWSDYETRYHFKQPDYQIWYKTADGSAAIVDIPNSWLNHGYQNTAPGSDGIGILRINIDITEIPDNLFENSNITEVFLPDKVETIGAKAFRNCGSLTDIHLGNNVETIGYQAFENCASLQSFVFPESLTDLGSRAFSDCVSLESVYIPDSWSSISYGSEDNPFTRCVGLKRFIGNSDRISSDGRFIIDNNGKMVAFATSGMDGWTYRIPEGVTSLGAQSMYGATVVRVILPESLTRIGWAALCNSSITRIDIPAGVTSIDSWAFDGCSNLTKVTLSDTDPDNISLSTDAFGSDNVPANENLEIRIPGTMAFITSRPGWELLLDHFVIYQSNKEIWYHLVGNEGTSLGQWYDGDYGATVTSQMALPPVKRYEPKSTPPSPISMEGIEFMATTFNGDVTKIAPYTFGKTDTYSYASETLDFVSLPFTVTEIGEGAFKDCSKLLMMPAPVDSLTSIGDDAFNGCTLMRASWVGNSGLEPIDWSIDYGSGGWDNYARLASIGDRAFKDCSSLDWALGSNSATQIGANAFENSKVYSVYFSGPVELGQGAFKNCSSLSSAEFSSLEVIPDEAFMGCTAMSKMPIPKDVITIGNDAFNGCSNLVMKNDGTSWASYPDNYFDTYFYLTSIGNRAFKNCGNLDWALMANTRNTQIGENAFERSGLLRVYFQDLRNLGQKAFRNSTKLKNAHLGAITVVNDSTFTSCSALEIVTFAQPHLVTSFGKDAFYRCINLTSLGIVDANGVSEVTSLQEINYESLASTGLTKLRLPNLKRTRGTRPFGSSPLTLLEIPSFETAFANTFLYMYSLSELDLPSIIDLRGTQLTSITKLKLGPNFSGFTNGQLYYYTGTTPLNLSIYLSKASVVPVQENTFRSLRYGTTEQMITIDAVYVPANLVDDYKADSRWVAALATANASVDVIQAMPTD